MRAVALYYHSLPQKKGRRVFGLKCGEFFVICYQNIIEHAQRSITAKIDGLM